LVRNLHVEWSVSALMVGGQFLIHKDPASVRCGITPQEVAFIGPALWYTNTSLISHPTHVTSYIGIEEDVVVTCRYRNLRSGSYAGRPSAVVFWCRLYDVKRPYAVQAHHLSCRRRLWSEHNNLLCRNDSVNEVVGLPDIELRLYLCTCPH
jgi:hypothetical protein